MSSVLLIAVISVVLFIASILFCPAIMVRYHKKGELCFRSVKIYPLIPLLGGVAMLVAKDLTIKQVADTFLVNSSVNPIRILVLFLSMTVFSLILDQTGFFGYISGVILQKSGKGQIRIFLTLYAVISLLTVFTSNDIVILTFTPFICYFCRAGRIDPVPYLVMEFVAANTWSLFLLIGNPTNIYISGAFEIGFTDYILIMALPTVAAGLVSLFVMLLLFRKRLSGAIEVETKVEPITDRPLMWVSLLHLILCVALLAVSQYIHLEMWLISLFMGLSAVVSSLLCLLVRKKTLAPLGRAISRMPFEIIPFVVGMFVLLLGLEGSGLTERLGSLLQGSPQVYSYGISSFLACNVLNNIPMSVLFSKILAFGGTAEGIFATVIGSNLGAFLTPVGALAGIMFFNLLKQNGVKLSTGRFVFYGLIVGAPALLSSLVVLSWVL